MYLTDNSYLLFIVLSLLLLSLQQQLAMNGA